MTSHAQSSTLPLSVLRRTGFAFALLCSLTAVAQLSIQAQTFTVLHSFTGGIDGGGPNGGLIVQQSNLYGLAAGGGSAGFGLAFKLDRRGTGWLLTSLYSFAGVEDGPDGADPTGQLAFGPDGRLYGTTFTGGVDCLNQGYGCGTVFSLAPPARATGNVLGSWTETQLYAFPNIVEGRWPEYGSLVFDPSGNIYGTTINGGHNGLGNVYQLTRSGDSWTENNLYSFSGADGEGPFSGVIRDAAGNLFGTAIQGGGGPLYLCPNGCGTVYELSPSATGWTENTIYVFQGGSDGATPVGGLILDAFGNLYGTTSAGGVPSGGTVFRLTPSSNGWTHTVLWSFIGFQGPYATLTMDTAGNIYGTTTKDGPQYGLGSVFKLAPVNGGWTETDLYQFTGGSDGWYPVSTVSIDQQGNLYGTASWGGAYGYGTVWEITP